jgi:BirA family biotin operon repressor/biotin-[acetyl-CoA-carboxylase] ligase
MDQRNKKIIFLNEIDSTNNYANKLILSDTAEEGTVVLARYQACGKGQMGNSWESEVGKNLLMSIIKYPKFLPASDQFLISKVVSLAITDLLQDEIDNCSIKWPNDIYIGDKKLAGILIENSVKGSNLFSSIIGIGLNVNQEAFISDAPNPVSLKQITGKSFDTIEVMENLIKKLDYWYNELENQSVSKIDKIYFSRLFRKNKWNLFSEPEEKAFEAQIIGIGKFGQLKLQLRNNSVREYMFKEIEFVL